MFFSEKGHMQIPFYFNTYLKIVEKTQFSFVTKLIKQIKQKKEYAIIFNISLSKMVRKENYFPQQHLQLQFNFSEINKTSVSSRNIYLTIIKLLNVIVT